MVFTKELSKFAGESLSSPFGEAALNGYYDYNSVIGQKDFIEKFSQRIGDAGSIDKISEEDNKFHDICMKSIEIAQKKGKVIDSQVRQEILDELIDQGLIKDLEVDNEEDKE